MSATIINWTKVLQKCSPASRKLILHARSTHEELRRLLLEQERLAPKLHLADYKGLLSGSTAKLLKEAEEQVRAVEAAGAATRDVSGEIRALEQEKANKLSESKAFMERLEIKIAALTAQLERLEKAKPVDELTVADVYDVHPEFQERVHEAIRKDDWSSSAADEQGRGGSGKEEKSAANAATSSPGQALLQEQLNYL